MDDKTYKEIVEEALSLIPHYTPEWTNHNPTDPGVTLIELFSWMTEMVLYRMNRVPEKTYLAMLDMMGLTLSAPQASRVLLRFFPVDGYEGVIHLKKGFQVSTSRSDANESVSFETDKRVSIQNNRILSCLSVKGTRVADHMPELDDPESGGFALFHAEEEMERYLYFSSRAFQFLREPNVVCLKVDQALDIHSSSEELLRLFEYEYWDGERWVLIEPRYSLKGEKKSENTLYFQGPLMVESCEVKGEEWLYVRAKLKEFPSDLRCFDVNTVTTRLIFTGDGILPDSCIFNSSTYMELDLEKDFKPFQDQPVVDDIFYLASDEVLSKKGARVSINLLLNESVKPSFPEDTLVMRYEFWDGSNWMILGVSRPGEEVYDSGPFRFKDETRAFCESGAISFVCPPNLSTKEIHGQERYWLRVRISVEDMGKGGGYRETDQGTWEWHFSEKIISPLISRLRLSYDAGHHSVDDLIVYSDYSYNSFKKELEQNLKTSRDNGLTTPFCLINASRDKVPYTCFGFEKALGSDEASLYFHLDEVDAREDFFSESFRSFNKRQISLTWEYCLDGEWKKLNVNDYTDSFHRSGFVEFQVPDGWESFEQYGQNLFWIRVIFENGSFESTPVLKNVYHNAVYASNCRTYGNEVLASGSGSPGQEYSLVRTPVLPGLQIEVRESTMPPETERQIIIDEEGPDAIRTISGKSGREEVWIRYHQVENFYESTSVSRHYVLDYRNNRVLFGDGKRAVIPPRGKNNIIVAHTRTGGGLKGNVGRGTIRILRESIPFLAAVNNPFPAQGGADLENLDNLKKRAAGVFRSRNRAVTAEDFSWLSFEASSSVGRAICLPRVNNQGEIVVIILPRREKVDLKEKLYPSSELIRRVKDYLDERKLVGTRLRVAGPLYRPVSIRVSLVFKKDIAETRTEKDVIEETLRRSLHPLLGENGSGWEFGRALQKEFVQRTLERIPSVHHLEDITLTDEQSGLEQERISLRGDELIFLNSFIIEDRRS